MAEATSGRGGSRRVDLIGEALGFARDIGWLAGWGARGLLGSCRRATRAAGGKRVGVVGSSVVVLLATLLWRRQRR